MSADNNMDNRRASRREQLGAFEALINRIRITLNFSVITESLGLFLQQKVDELKDFITGQAKQAQDDLDAGVVDADKEVQYWDQILDQVEKEIEEKTHQIQDEIEVETTKEKNHMSSFDERLKVIVENLDVVLKGFNTLKVERKAWADFVDFDIQHESTGMYVVASQPGYFTDEHVPAFKMLKVISILVSALVEEEHRLKHLERAEKAFEEAWWEGVDPNTKELRSNFLHFRHDADASSPESYSEHLGQICVNGEKLQADTPKSKSVERNIYNAIKLIAVICSMPHTKPLQTTPEEQKLSVEKCGNSIEYAVSKQNKLS